VFTKKYNIGFHLPKKDKCRLCTTYENRNSPVKDIEENQKLHLQEKEESKAMFLQY
jgi:hypothetical protein